MEGSSDRCCTMVAGASQGAAVGAHGDLAQWASGSVPSKRSKVQVHRLSSDFRAATHIVSEPLPAPNAIPPGHILVRRAYAGAAELLHVSRLGPICSSSHYIGGYCTHISNISSAPRWSAISLLCDQDIATVLCMQQTSLLAVLQSLI